MMKKVFRVWFEQINQEMYEVEAESPEGAREKAYNKYGTMKRHITSIE